MGAHCTVLHEMEADTAELENRCLRNDAIARQSLEDKVSACEEAMQQSKQNAWREHGRLEARISQLLVTAARDSDASQLELRGLRSEIGEMQSLAATRNEVYLKSLATVQNASAGVPIAQYEHMIKETATEMHE